MICLTVGLTVASMPPVFADTLRWFSAGRPTVTAHQAVELLVSAADDGLDANDYGANHLRKAIDSAASGPLLPDHRVAQIDQTLSSAMVRYLADLHGGRVDPQQLAENFTPLSAPGFDPDALLLTAIASGRLAEAARRAAPPLAQYLELQEALARYRELAGNPAWHKALPQPADGKLTPGQAYAGLAVLIQRLRLLGDLPATGAPPSNYDGKVVDGVRSFQERHGLTADGVIGKGTLEQLNIAPEERVRQLELALERLRWTPLPPAGRAIVVNVPEFRLRAYEMRDDKVEITC